MNLPYPKHPGATNSQLRTYHNQRTRWHTLNQPQPDPETQMRIVQLVETSTTTEEYLAAYRVAELANMVYFELSNNPQESKWIWT
jgi:hypothetical protein